MYKKILVGVDNSELSMKVLDKAIELHKRDKSEIVVFHSVLQKLGDLSPAFGQAITPGVTLSYDLHHDRIKQAEKLLKDIEAKFKEENVPVETRLELYIGPQYYIEKQVEEEDFDLVLLGCNGEHSKLRRTFLGTVPEHVLNNAKSDVLIIK